MASAYNPMELLREGMDVYGADAEKLGSVGRVHYGVVTGPTSDDVFQPRDRSYFQVRRGFLGLGDDVWLPAEAIGDVEGERVNLRLTKEEAVRTGWDDAPGPSEVVE